MVARAGNVCEALPAFPGAVSVYQYEPLEAYLKRLESKGHRIVIFNVSGKINLESSLLNSFPYITIAGQT